MHVHLIYSMKNFLKFIFSKAFLLNIVIAVVLFFLLSYLALFFIGKYTSHGISVVVPELRNLSVEEANNILNIDELQVEVIDSIFILDKKPGIIIEQNPVPNSKIKKGRKVYVVINSKTKKKVPFPEIKDYSYRQAQTMLEALGLKVASVEYVPAEFKSLVLYAKTNNGNIIDAGQELDVGTSIVLVVGKGLSEETIHLPSFRGLTLPEARTMSIEIFINIGSTHFDVKPENPEDAKNYVIYKQKPIAGTEVRLGKDIELWLTRDKSKIEEEIEEIQISDDYGIENFFN